MEAQLCSEKIICQWYVLSRTLYAWNMLSPCRLNMGAFIMKRSSNYSITLLQYIHWCFSHLITFSLFSALTVCCLTDAISVRIDVHPLKRGFNPGDNVTLTCLVVHGGPADVILWYKDDQPISANSYSNSSQMAEISLLNITRSDAARYKCTAWKKQVKYTDSIDLHMNGKKNCNDKWGSGLREINPEITLAIIDNLMIRFSCSFILHPTDV